MSEQDPVAAASFEQLLKMLDASLERLDSNALTLEESIDEYDRAVQLAAAASALLEQAELRITEISARLDMATDAVDKGDSEADW